ncbi:MAG: HD domain-containing protein [Bacteroidetes bacterium]|nr:MAG: HD domain-containing protein [Bacteroidota bacterium]REK08179.1 MAG: HD domain-containing protein [Bacteroidota bacterium]REK32384.1 MAG: HD domain-containing protein [Bacteroidota bacterium]REK47436.1 MAG: HD domain-containing protein [Bacteroidota bacterium]
MLMRQKIVNDPIYGFITIPYELVFQLIEHPYFQRLRRIRQLGMTHLVYPGAHHTRFHHALGAMHLMGEAIKTLRSKGHQVSDEEAEAVTVAILLHDIGHGPFSHALEDSIVQGIRHEDVGLLFMEKLNKEMNGRLNLAIMIFQNRYHKKFLHQLVSSQLDMDRMDYLSRDSFFTGVSEGVISHDRIIKMLEVHDDQLAVEEKGIYSIEKFIVARRLMYWQVYLHKTVVSAECLLINILKRAKEVIKSDSALFATPALNFFLNRRVDINELRCDPSLLDRFAELDDSDITTSVKIWAAGKDEVLSDLCRRMINRRLFRIILQNTPFMEEQIEAYRNELKRKFGYDEAQLDYFFLKGKIVNNAYNTGSDKISILLKSGKVCDITEAADTLNIKSLSVPVEKYYLAFPK